MTIQEWLDDFGEQNVIQLAKELGGRRVYIPAKGPLPAKLAGALGQRAERLREYRGERLDIPRLTAVVTELAMSRARQEARAMLRQGLSARFISRATGLSRPSIAKLRAR